jgi:predicted dehydrogenase
MARLRMAVIGVGHLGKEHARILAGLPDVELVGVADVNFAQAQAVAQRCRTQAYDSFLPLLTQVDAATVVVPTTDHAVVASEFLQRGIALFVEKPLADSLAHAEELVGLARRHGTLLQVGHIERFNPAFEELQRRPMQPKFVVCERLGPFTGRSTDIGVVLDLMIHDLDLVRTLVRAPVQSVDALGVALFGGREDVAHARLTFANGCVASLSASRASASPVRRMQVWAPEGYASLDFARRHLTLIQPSEGFRRHGLDLERLDPAARGQLRETLFHNYFQRLELDRNDAGDQLTNELRHFITCIRTNTRPRIGGEDGRDVIALAARILEAIRTHAWEGRPGSPAGPADLPASLGLLFRPAEGRAAA